MNKLKKQITTVLTTACFSYTAMACWVAAIYPCGERTLEEKRKGLTWTCTDPGGTSNGYKAATTTGRTGLMDLPDQKCAYQCTAFRGIWNQVLSDSKIVAASTPDPASKACTGSGQEIVHECPCKRYVVETRFRCCCRR